MSITHQEFASGRWKELSFVEQMANVGSELERTISWEKKGNEEYSRMAFERMLELLDLTIKNAKPEQLKELVRARELATDYFVFDNQYHSSDEDWQKYFYAFTYAARINR